MNAFRYWAQDLDTCASVWSGARGGGALSNVNSIRVYCIYTIIYMYYNIYIYIYIYI